MRSITEEPTSNPSLTVVPAPRPGFHDLPRIDGQWWVSMARRTDEMARRLVEQRSAWLDLADQIVRDAPHMVSQLRRIEAQAEGADQEIFRVRLLISTHCGDTARAADVATAHRALVNRLRHYEERTTQVLYEAYERDIGGECA